MLNKVKQALRISTNAFDDEIKGLIEAGKKDIEVVGIEYRENDPLMERAVIMYCKLFFGEPDNFYNLKKAYDEQKAQLRENSLYQEN